MDMKSPANLSGRQRAFRLPALLSFCFLQTSTLLLFLPGQILLYLNNIQATLTRSTTHLFITACKMTAEYAADSLRFNFLIPETGYSKLRNLSFSAHYLTR